MKRRKKSKIVALILGLILIMQSFTVQAAGSDGYVIGTYNQTKQVVTDTSIIWIRTYLANAGGYQVKEVDGKLYSRKGKSGTWKKIASGVRTFTTNGKNVYYVKNTYDYNKKTGNSKIYCVSVNGGNAKVVKTISKARIDSIYRYGDKLYLTVCKEKFDSTMYTYSLTTKKTKKIKDRCMIVDAYKRNAITLDESPTKNTYVVKTMDLITGKETRLAENCSGFLRVGKYIYYTSYTRYIRLGSQGTFVVKRANIDGSGVKTLTPQLTGVFQDMNSHSVTYTDSNGIKQIIRY